MAEGLIAIAAQRALKHVEEAHPPHGMFDEFCARFPYEETDDQLNAIADVLADLETGKPMDRLICGDQPRSSEAASAPPWALSSLTASSSIC